MIVRPLKFKLKVGQTTEIKLQGTYYGMRFAMQRGEPHLWVNQANDGREYTLSVYVALTGEEVDVTDREYIGLAMNDDQSFVVHGYASIKRQE